MIEVVERCIVAGASSVSASRSPSATQSTRSKLTNILITLDLLVIVESRRNKETGAHISVNKLRSKEVDAVGGRLTRQKRLDERFEAREEVREELRVVRLTLITSANEEETSAELRDCEEVVVPKSLV